MILNTSSLGGLSCGNDKGCSCGCTNSKLSSSLGDLPWSCSTFGLFCPSTEEIIKDTSDYGGMLSIENRLKAEQMTRDIIKNDNPCNYSELDGMSEIDKMMKCGQVNWTLVGLVGIGGFILLKHV